METKHEKLVVTVANWREPDSQRWNDNLRLKNSKWWKDCQQRIENSQEWKDRQQQKDFRQWKDWQQWKAFLKPFKQEWKAYIRPFVLERKAIERDFAEWLFPGGLLVGREHLQEALRAAWRLVSAGKKQAALLRINKMELQYSRLQSQLRDDSPADDCKRKRKAVVCMLETLSWLRAHTGLLMVCANPKCNTRRTYFLRVYSNDKYCCAVCVRQAKELRQEQRDRERQQPLKKYKVSKDSREKMSASAAKRWARERAKTGAPKYSGLKPC